MFKWLKQWKEFKEKLKKENKLYFWVVDWIETIVVALILALIIRQFAFQTSEVMSGSMIPTLQIRDRVIVNKLVYKLKEPKRGEIILFKSTIDPRKDFIKRLVALPGEEVAFRNGMLLINGKVISQSQWDVVWDSSAFGPKKVPANSYFFVGDNRPQSYDSRFWGFVPKKNIIGKAFLLVWPPFHIRLLNQ
ncbi:signal peptidase I [Candidatus Margulisiibacteriota bacterium]